MKKSFYVLPIIFCLFTVNSVFGQTEVEVSPFVPDALFNAVSAANPGDVLILADGGIYPNTAEIPVSVPLTIKTVDGFAAKATVVKAADASGAYAHNCFKADASLTIKNVVFDGQQGTLGPNSGRFIDRGTIGEGKIYVDGIEVSRYDAVSMGGDVDTLICENSLFNGCLSVAGGWGGTWDFQGDIVKYVRIQNNTFMFTTFGPFLGNGWGNYAPAVRQIPTVIIDHNTVYNATGAHGPTTMFTRVEDVQITNNLYINPTLRPNEFFSDKYIDFPQNADDITPFIGQISTLGPKGLWVISIEMVDSAGTQIDMRSNNITYTSDVLNAWSTRGLDPCWVWTNETEAAIIDKDNAYFEEEVTFVDAPDVPMFAVNAIADTSVKGNADPVTYEGETPFAGWNWWDPATLEAVFDYRTKAEMDMSYNTDATSYTAGTDGFPLGDLNWFPDKYAEWLVTDVERNDNGMPSEFSLSQNYPNPFNPSTKINFTLPEAGLVTLKVFNVLGQEVAELINEEMKPGKYNVDFNASELSSGLYVYQITAGTFTSSMKMMLLK